MDTNEKIEALRQEMSDRFDQLNEKQNAQYTDIMLEIKKLEDAVIALKQEEKEYPDDDDAFEAAKKLVIEAQKASTSFLQRRLGLGYARAARRTS